MWKLGSPAPVTRHHEPTQANKVRRRRGGPWMWGQHLHSRPTLCPAAGGVATNERWMKDTSNEWRNTKDALSDMHDIKRTGLKHMHVSAHHFVFIILFSTTFHDSSLMSCFQCICPADTAFSSLFFHRLLTEPDKSLQHGWNIISFIVHFYTNSLWVKISGCNLLVHPQYLSMNLILLML